MAEQKRALAIAAHPDDIEFQMAGTLILLKRAGFEIHKQEQTVKVGIRNKRLKAG